VMGLLATNGKATGSAKFKGEELVGMKTERLNTIRGSKMTMIFQDPMTSLTPHLRISRQLTEVLVVHKGMSERDARARALSMLDRVKIPDAKRRLDEYPHEFSGGMRQRVMIAMALICEPELLIADEPSTALDVTVQAQILELMQELSAQGDMSIIMITHDLGVIAGLCSRVMVMYAGEFCETGEVDKIFHDPQHPYTRGLVGSIPRLDKHGGRLTAIRGQPPNLQHLPKGCTFQERCDFVFDRCIGERPKLIGFGGGRAKSCHLKGFDAKGEVVR
jgi:oligopeptide transport system ATP-binding protein